MTVNSKQIYPQFEKKVRVRVCGILKENHGILLINHEGLGPGGHLWSPPGGGVEFGETLHDSLKREFLEETNLEVAVDDYLFTNEHIDDQFHAIELFFKVSRISGHLRLGADPELPATRQLISEVKFFNIEDLNNLPKNTLHRAFHLSYSRDKIDEIRGLITFKD